MKKGLLVLIITLFASTTLMANGLSLNSIGPRALGMGGAMVGLADDPTAIYWNPAGLAGQNSSLLIFGTDVIPYASYKNATYGIDAKAKVNNYISPNLFFNYNLGKLALGLGAYVPAGLGTEWDGKDLVVFNGPNPIPVVIPGDTLYVDNPYAGKAFKWKSKIAVFDFSPNLAYKISDMISVGAGLNAYYGMMELERAEDLVNLLAQFGLDHDGLLDTQVDYKINGWGFGGLAGIKICPMENLSIGFTYKTPVNVNFSGDGHIGENAITVDKLEIEWPMWFGGGISFNITDKWLISFDAQYSNWKSLKELYANIKLPDGSTKVDTMYLDWKDATQIRVGTEYMLNEQLTIRAGYYYDPAPAPDETLNILFPSSTNNVITGGLGYVINKIKVDFGIEYLFGKERDVAQAEHNMPGIHKLDVLAFSLGVCIGLM